MGHGGKGNQKIDLTLCELPQDQTSCDMNLLRIAHTPHVVDAVQSTSPLDQTTLLKTLVLLSVLCLTHTGDAMKIVIPPNGFVLAIGNPKRVASLASDLDNRVLGVVPTTNYQTIHRKLQWCETLPDLMPAVPVFSAVVIDHTGMTDAEISEHKLKRHWPWASQFVVPGGWFVVYGDAQCMPDSCYAWDDAQVERAVRWGPTTEQERFNVICCGVSRVTAGPVKGELRAKMHTDTSWFRDLCLVCPPAHHRAANMDRSEYTDDEMSLLGQTDSALMDFAAEDYRVTEIEQPPLQLGVGHLGLMIASGQLAGKIETPGKPPHVMRGISRKVERTHVDERGREVTTEQVEIVVRTINNQGVIQEYTA